MSTTAGSGVEVLAIDTPSLGDRSYLAHDGAVALVSTRSGTSTGCWPWPPRGVAVTHVFETHVHNDYVTGGLALARADRRRLSRQRAPTRWRSAGWRSRRRRRRRSGRSMRVRVIATPGHTFTHLAYALEDAATGAAVAVFTGGSLLHGSTGRRTCSAPSTRAASPPPSTPRRVGWPRSCRTGRDVYPTHGFGSFCAATPSARPTARPSARSGGSTRR